MSENTPSKPAKEKIDYATRNYHKRTEQGAHLAVVPVGIHGQPISPKTNAKVNRLKPLQEQALQLYAIGKLDQKGAAAHAGCSVIRFNDIVNSAAGQAIIAGVRAELEHQFQAQFKDVIDVISQGLNHPEPSIALAAANLWLKNNRAQKVEVKVTAEDLVNKIMNGEL